MIMSKLGEAQGFPEQFLTSTFGDYQMYYLSIDEYSKKLENNQNGLTGEYMPAEEEELPEDLERMVISHILGNEPMAFNDIVKESKMSHDRVASTLAKLELDGIVAQLPKKVFKRIEKGCTVKLESEKQEEVNGIKAKIHAGELAEVVSDNLKGVGGYTAQIHKKNPSFESEEHFVDHLLEVTDNKIVIMDQKNLELVNGEVFSVRFRLAGDTPTSICKVLMDTGMCDSVIPMDEYGVYTARVSASNPKFKGNNEFILWLSSALTDKISVKRSETDGSGENEVLVVTFKVDMTPLSAEDIKAKVGEIADSVYFEDGVYAASLKTESMGLMDFRDSIKQIIGEHIVISEYRIKQSGGYIVKFTPKGNYIPPGEDTPKKKGRKPKAKKGQSKKTTTPKGDEKISTKEDRIPEGEPSRFQDICEDYDIKVGSRVGRSIYRAGNDEASAILRYQRREGYWRLALLGANPDDFPGLEVTKLRGHTAPHLDFSDPKSEENLRKHIEKNFLVS